MVHLQSLVQGYSDWQVRKKKIDMLLAAIQDGDADISKAEASVL